MKRTNKPLNLKTGEVLPIGQEVAEWNVKGMATLCKLASGHLVRVRSAFKSPSEASLRRWDDEGFCMSVMGERVEPDGMDCHGSPSWMLALGLI
jgi:hypothetical protein